MSYPTTSQSDNMLNQVPPPPQKPSPVWLMAIVGAVIALLGTSIVAVMLFGGSATSSTPHPTYKPDIGNGSDSDFCQGINAQVGVVGSLAKEDGVPYYTELTYISTMSDLRVVFAKNISMPESAGAYNAYIGLKNNSGDPWIDSVSSASSFCFTSGY